MNCAAINPQWHDEYFLSFPLGLATIISVAKKNGHDVRVIDFDAERMGDEEKKDLLGRIRPEPKAVLLTAMVTNYLRVKKLSEIVKVVWPRAVVVLGGSLATTAPDAVLEKICADIFVVGEGDEVIVSILRAVEEGEGLDKIPGIRIKERGALSASAARRDPPDLAKTPRPAYEDFPMKRYIEFLKNTGRSFETYTSKGCPFRCSFCYRISGDEVRHRPVEHVVDEIGFVRKTYSMDRFSFEDDNFGLNSGWVERFCALIRDMAIKFRFQANVNTLNEKLLDRLKGVGLEGVSIGIESGSPSILRQMGKNIDIARAERAVKMLGDRGIKLNATFIVGAPGENDESVEMTKNFLIRNGFKNNFQLFFLTPYPGTPLYHDAVKRGLIRDELGYIENLGLQNSLSLNMTSYPDEKLIEWKGRILSQTREGLASSQDEGVTWKREAVAGMG